MKQMSSNRISKMINAVGPKPARIDLWFSKSDIDIRDIVQIEFCDSEVLIRGSAIFNGQYFILDSSNCLMKKRLYD